MKKISIIILLSGFIITGCTHKLEEINVNPNQPDKVSNPGLLLPNVIRSSARSNLTNSYNRFAIAADQLAEDFQSNFSNWVRADAASYSYWNFYDYIRDLNTVIDLADKQSLNNYKGVALVLRSWMFQCLTDTYGPIPFREADNASLKNITQPKFEKQEDVYAGLLQDLHEANTLLGSSSENVVGDILYNGNITRWKQFASGLMLRLLLRESDRIDPSSAMREIVSQPDLYPLFTSNEDQAALQYIADRPENEMPLYRSQSSGYGTGTRITQTFLNELEGLNDPRMYAFASPTSASLTAGTRVYKGEVNGTGAFNDPPNSSPAGMLWTSIFFSPDLASPNAAQSVILSYSEVQFTLAEAAEKGFIAGGSAKAEEYYLNGIKDQFKYYASRIPSNYTFPRSSDIIPPSSYYDQPGVTYTGTQQEKLHKIWLQKRFALFLSGAEAWSEWRRTDFPDIQPGPQSPGYVPLRCLYPADEMRINTQNYNEAVSWLGADDMTQHVWWDK